MRGRGSKHVGGDPENFGQNRDCQRVVLSDEVHGWHLLSDANLQELA